MPETSGFFNSKVLDDGSYDRVYLAENFADYFASFVGNGVFANKLNALQVIVDSAMNVKVRAGQAWINGYWYENDSDLSLTLSTAPTTGYRTDSIVVRYGVTDRSIKCYVKKGALNTVNPAPIRDSEYYELVLAYIKVSAGTVTISQSMITDKRGDKSVCGYVTGLIDQIDTTDFYTQLNGWLEEYMNKTENQYNSFSNYLSQKKNTADSDLSAFEGDLNTLKTSATNDVNALIEEIRGLLDGDVATNLQNQIDKVAGDLSKSNERISKTEQDAEPNKKSFVIMPTSDGLSSEYYEVASMIPGHSYCLIAYNVDDANKKIYVTKRRFDYCVTNELKGSYLAKPTKCVIKRDENSTISKNNFVIPEDLAGYTIVPIVATTILDFAYFYLFKSGNDVVLVDEFNFTNGLQNYDGLANPKEFFGSIEPGTDGSVLTPIKFPVIALKIRSEKVYASNKTNIIFSDVTDQNTMIKEMYAPINEPLFGNWRLDYQPLINVMELLLNGIFQNSRYSPAQISIPPGGTQEVGVGEGPYIIGYYFKDERYTEKAGTQYAYFKDHNGYVGPHIEAGQGNQNILDITCSSNTKFGNGITLTALTSNANDVIVFIVKMDTDISFL